jgi:hypothetical protein
VRRLHHRDWRICEVQGTPLRYACLVLRFFVGRAVRVVPALARHRRVRRARGVTLTATLGSCLAAAQPPHPCGVVRCLHLTLTESGGRPASVATTSLCFPAPLADRPGLLSGRSPACGSPCRKLRSNIAASTSSPLGGLFSARASTEPAPLLVRGPHNPSLSPSTPIRLQPPSEAEAGRHR